ncbi:hypothetical protein KKB44_00295 [Candidatus Micrarchaeota archaeon]|nr:hypothetical protein [Candidatus Micrarchaeota archaeon]
MRLTRKTIPKERKNEWSNKKPLAAAIVVGSVFFARPLFADECSATVREGQPEQFATVSEQQITVNVLTLNGENYIEFSLPATFTEAVSQLPENERTVFLTNVFRANITEGLSRLGDSSTVTFECIDAPAVETTDEELIIRRRTVEPKAAPIPPSFENGKGTKADPFAIIIPVPVKYNGEVGSVLYDRDDSPYFLYVGNDDLIYFTFRFIGVESDKVTTKAQLTRSIAAIMSDHANRYCLEKGRRQTFSTSDMSDPARQIVDEAADAIQEYAPE